MNDIRLVAIDLDGTLLSNDFVISPRAQSAIRQVRDRGVFVTICTGRMYASALPYATDLGLDLPLVTYQGALVKTSGTGEVLYRREVPVNLARSVIAMANEYAYPANVYYGDRLYVERLSPEGALYVRRARIPVNVVEDLLGFVKSDPIKVLVMSSPENLDAFAREWQARYGDRLYLTKSMPTYLEFTHPEATKGRGLAAVASHLGVDRTQVMAIGDSWNDLEMFSYAGFSVVMGNAPEDVKRVADYVTRNNDDDGVAEALEKFFL